MDQWPTAGSGLKPLLVQPEAEGSHRPPGTRRRLSSNRGAHLSLQTLVCSGLPFQKGSP